MSEYRAAKQTVSSTRDKVRKHLVAEFEELEKKMGAIQAELRTDFGVRLKPNLPPPASRPKKAPSKTPARRGRPPKAAPVPVPTQKKSLTALQKKVSMAHGALRKAESAGATGDALQKFKDKVYQLEDQLALAQVES